MNPSNSSIERKPTIILNHPVVGISGPEFQDFAKAAIKAIGRATKKLLLTLGGATVRGWRFLERKSREGAEIHNRQVQSVDERYSRNWHYLRSML